MPTIEEIHKRVNKLTRKTIEKVIYSCGVDIIFTVHGRSIMSAIEYLNSIKLGLVEDHHIENPETIFIKLKMGSYRTKFEFYIIIQETDKEFEKRKERSLKTSLANIDRHKRKEALLLERKQKERKEQLKSLIKDFGDEIYDVFKEIKLNA